MVSRIQERRKSYQQERQFTIIKHRLEAAKVKTAWKQHERTQKKEWAVLAKDHPAKPDTAFSPREQRIVDAAAKADKKEKPKTAGRDTDKER